MSFINKLQIRGIRSFGPDEDENIEFYTPLTMIVGQNGCGKTTIIESLKFACTGILPPNAQKGQSMVNDPGMTDTTEVKAHIKLLFKNRAGKDCLAIRSLQVSKKKKKLEFKALEGVIKTTNDQNEPVSLAHRCSEMDQIIPENLGVSSAILENVIFVHQEESNWPLQEGAVLKKKFDDVFESTRYTKALEALAKTKKDIQVKAKELKAELGELGAHLAAATMSRKELEDNQTNQNSCEEDIQQINTRLQSTETQLKESIQAYEQAREQLNLLEKVQWKVKEAERRIQDKENSVETLLTNESNEDLNHILHNFAQEMNKRTNDLQGLIQQRDQVTRDVEKLQQEMTQLTVKKGQGDLFVVEIQTMKVDLMTSLQSLSRKYPKLTTITTSLTVGNWNSRLARDVLNVLNQEWQSLQEEQQQQSQSHRSQLQEMDKTCQEISTKIAKVDMETNYKTEESRNMMLDMDKKRSELLKLTSSRALLTTKQQEYDVALRNYDDFMQQFQVKSVDIKRQLKEVNEELHQVQEQIAEDHRLVQELSFHRQEMTTLDVQYKSVEQDKVAIMIDLDHMMNSHRDLFMKTSLAKKWTNSQDLLAALKTVEGLEEVVSTWQEEVQQCQQHFKSQQQHYVTLQSDVLLKAQLVQQGKDRVQTLRPKILLVQEYQQQIQVCIQQLNTLRTGRILGDYNYDMIPNDRKIEEILKDAKTTEEDVKELLIIEKSGKQFLKRMKKFRQKNASQCPCCLQDMTSNQVIAQYEQRVQVIFACGDISVEELEPCVQQCNEIYKTLQDIQQKMLPLMTIQEELNTCEQGVKDLETQQRAADEEISSVKDEVQHAEEHCQQITKLQMTLQDVLFRFKQMKQKKDDLLERKRRQQQSLLAATSSSSSSSSSAAAMTNAGDGTESDPFRNLDALEQQVQRQLEHKDHLQSKKEKLTLEESNLMKKSYTLKSLLNDYEKALSDVKVDGNKANDIDAFLTSLQVKITEIEARKQVMIREKEVLVRQLQEQKSILQSKKTEFDQQEATSQSKGMALKQDRDAFNRQVEHCEEVERKLQEIQLPQVETQLQRLQQQLQQQKKCLQDEWQPRIQDLQQALTSQEQTKRNVVQNIELRQLQNELQGLQREYQEMQSKYGDGQGQQSLQRFKQQQEQLQRDKQNWASQYHQINGKLAVYSQNIQELQRKLSSGLYRDVEEKHRMKNIEFETTNIAVVDLTNYYNAL